MNLELYIERIEAYESKTLPEIERLEFEEALLSDAQLQEAYTLYHQADEAIEWQISESLRTQMQIWEQETPASTVAPKQSKLVAFRRIRWAAAAALVLLLGLWFVLDRGENHTNSAELYAAYYTAPDASGLRGGNVSDSPLKTGLIFLEEGKGQEAYKHFESLMQASGYNEEYRYYMGHAAMLMKDWKAADSAFSDVESTGTETLAQKAAWNRALIRLAEGDISYLKNRLEAIRQNPDHSYFMQAGELLERLK